MGKKGAVGKIYLFDFNKPNDAAKDLNIVAEAKYKSLNPHGISYWNDTETGIGRTLYPCNEIVIIVFVHITKRLYIYIPMQCRLESYIEIYPSRKNFCFSY